MSSAPSARKLLAVLCLAALLFAVLTAGTAASAFAILLPLWLLVIATLVFIALYRPGNPVRLIPAPVLRTGPSRAPPLR